ncbi:hypothetical protein HanIR_Chr11g0558911 [Helianthus annuus]|nr:hypothetical protein HanIR_Chr11g0558911 [Helianthus annuus]
MTMAKKLKPQGPEFKKFEFWTKVTKPQGHFDSLLYIVFLRIQTANMFAK